MDATPKRVEAETDFGATLRQQKSFTPKALTPLSRCLRGVGWGRQAKPTGAAAPKVNGRAG